MTHSSAFNASYDLQEVGLIFKTRRSKKPSKPFRLCGVNDKKYTTGIHSKKKDLFLLLCSVT